MTTQQTIAHEAHELHAAIARQDWNEVAWHVRNLVHLTETRIRHEPGGTREHIRTLGASLQALGRALVMEGG